MASRGADKRSNRVTVYDVAAHAGVSQTTVTHVLTGARPVSIATTERVQASIRELNFRPNELARALRRQRVDSVALVVPSLAQEFFPAFAHGAGTSLRARGHLMQVHETGGEDGALGTIVETMVAHGVHSAIFAGITIDEAAATIIDELDLTFVLQGPESVLPAGLRGATVRVDQAAGIRLAVRCVAEHTAQPIAFVGGPLHLREAQIRARAFHDAMSELHRPLDESRIRHGEYSWLAGKTSTEALLAEDDLGGIVCANDLIAIGAMSALREAGRRVPEDVRVTGFDNIEASAMSVPGLTSIELFPEDQAEAAVAAVLGERLEQGSRHTVVQPVLVRRASC